VAYDYPFQLLNSDQVPLLASSGKSLNAYIDCLALLQGTIAPLSSYPIFNSYEDLALVDASFNQFLSEIPDPLTAAIRKNRETASDIIKETTAKEGVRRGITQTQIRKAADDFIEGLITQYQILRQAGSKEIPLEMSAGA
jgi:hypothetical protein